MAVGDMLLVRGTTVLWRESPTGGEEDLDLGDTAIGGTGVVGVGAYHDFGADPRPDEYEIVLVVDGFASNPAAAGVPVNVYIAESSDATVWSGPATPSDTADSVGNINRLSNLKPVLTVVTWSTTAADQLIGAATFRSTARYIAPVVHNGTSVNMKTTSDAHRLRITPIYYRASQS